MLYPQLSQNSVSVFGNSNSSSGVSASSSGVVEWHRTGEALATLRDIMKSSSVQVEALLSYSFADEHSLVESLETKQRQTGAPTAAVALPNMVERQRQRPNLSQLNSEQKKAIRKFRVVTDTDEVTALLTLDDNDWNVQSAVFKYVKAQKEQNVR